MSLGRSLRLGASLYMPATRPDLGEILAGRKLPTLRSLIVCTEDAVLAHELPRALDHLESALKHLEPSDTLRFVRVRDPMVLRRVGQMPGAERLDGFVLPKVTLDNLPIYFAELPARAHFMLTLETREVFDPQQMRRLANLVSRPPYAPRLWSMRIGGNDLLGLLALRRSRGTTIYDTPLGQTISELVTTFRPLGINLTAPVYDGVDEDLEREVQLDLCHGLFGKTAIHPTQVPRIEALYRVSQEELATAERVLSGRAPAVSLVDQRMCEPSTQVRWAELIVARAEVYGVAYHPSAVALANGPTSQ